VGADLFTGQADRASNIFISFDCLLPSTQSTMAALLPPPKRQKTYHGVPEPIPEPVQSTVNILVQFVSEDDGMPMAPAVSLPANVSRDGLETLVNRLKSQANTSISLRLFTF